MRTINRLTRLTKKSKKLIFIFLISIGALAVFNEIREVKLQKRVENLQEQLRREEIAIHSLYSNMEFNFSQAEVYSNEAMLMAGKAVNSEVCSEANRYNNNAQEAYVSFKTYISKIDKDLPEYQEKYENVTKLLSQINEIQKQLNIKESEYSTLTVKSYEFVCARRSNIHSNDTELVKKLKQSQNYADKLYKEYYTLMLKLVTGEAGDYYYPDLDQFCVMNVAENRVKSEYFPDTIKEVIFQPGQYQPTWDGSWSKKADERTKKNVEKYLRGEVETGMPDNVIFQAMFKQGDYVWKHITNKVDIGHYYCAKL